MKQDSLQLVMDAIWQRKVTFLLVFSGVLAISYGLLVMIDFVPEAPTDVTVTEQPQETSEQTEVETQTEPTIVHNEAGSATAAPLISPDAATLPVSITFDRFDKVIPVSNPTSREVADLDAGLLKGAVRHPDSATFADEGTIFILGHSSYLPTVFNKNFQAFNGIQDLEWGDTVRLRSADAEYVYRVEKVYKAKASEVTVPIANTGPRLVLATCNSFASKDDRFIVESKLIEVITL